MNLVELIIPIFLAFREGLEAILVIVIILLYLKKTNQKQYYKFVYLGAIGSIICSIIFAFIFYVLFGEFSGFLEQIFEGFIFILSGLIIISLILWISIEGPKMKESLEKRIGHSIETKKIYSISLITFIIIIREGIELVLLLIGAISVGNLKQETVIIGATLGLILSLIIGILTYYGFQTINLSKFFKITNILLILFATGLITYGIHELIDAGIINPLIDEVWNINYILPENFPDNNPKTSVWIEIIGSLLKVLFGYNANPSLIEIIIYPLILSIISFISWKLWKIKTQKNDNTIKTQ